MRSSFVFASMRRRSNRSLRILKNRLTFSTRGQRAREEKMGKTHGDRGDALVAVAQRPPRLIDAQVR